MTTVFHLGKSLSFFLNKWRLVCLDQVTLENLIELTGATVEETDLKQQITDEDLKDALLGTEGGGVSYEVVSTSPIPLKSPRLFVFYV